MTNKRGWIDCGLILLSLALFVTACVLQGCAVGRRDVDGAIVLGFEAGKLTETGDQILAAGGTGILSLLGMGAGPAGAIGLLAAKLWKDAETEKAKRYAESKGWEEAKKDTLTQYGGGVVLPPVPTPPPVPVAGATT